MGAADKIRQLAEQKVAEKRKEQEELLQSKLDADIADVEKVLEEIQNKTLYKKGKYYYDPWTLVTEEIFYNDYFKEPAYQWNRGIKFKDFERSNESYIVVNGESYYYIQYLLNSYADELKKCIERTQSELEKLVEKKKNFEDLCHSEPQIKKMIEEWLNHQKEIEENKF